MLAARIRLGPLTIPRLPLFIPMLSLSISGRLPLSGLSIPILPTLGLLMQILHIFELLSHLTGCPGNRYDEIEDEPVQYIEYDGEEKYFW